jgi:mono/diheme cytochrome c family protein
MKQYVAVILVCICSLGVTAFVQALDEQAAKEPAGKTIFLNEKCNTCHSIDSAAITKKMASSKAPDLSNVGSEQKAEWIVKWLKKEETLHEKKHLATFKGTEEDMKTVAAWLETLKKPAEKKN